VSAAWIWGQRVPVHVRAQMPEQLTGIPSFMAAMGDIPYTDTSTTQALGERYAQQVGHTEMKRSDGTSERW
jgi:hypothetical protein